MGDLGLPPGYNPRFIPSSSRLRQASVLALETWTSFVMANKDSPEIIVKKLDKIAKAIRAALDVKGDHIPKAVKLALELEMRYWAYDNRYEEWLGLMGQLLKVAPDLDDVALKSEIFRAWGVYLHVMREQAKAKVAVKVALEYAEESRQESLRLLTRAEDFHLSIRSMSLSEAQSEASALFAAAERLHFPYVMGRACLSLAWRCQQLSLSQRAFNAAQQALVCFASPEIVGMQAYAVSLMLSNIQFNNTHSPAYRQRLLNYMTTLIQRSVNSHFRAEVAHLQANEAYYQGRYAEARRYALIAWLNYRDINHDAIGCRDMQHLLGMIENQLGRPAAAERHLKAAGAYFRAAGETMRRINAQHALAWVPFMHGDPARALEILDGAIALIDTLAEKASRETVRNLLLEDRQKIELTLRESAA